MTSTPSSAAIVRRCLGALAALVLLGGAATADFPRAALTALSPAGGKQGTQVTVTLLGGDLDDLERLVFSHPGITAVPATTPPTEFDPQPRPIPRTMVVTIAPEVPAGLYDVVAVGRFGASAARGFVVGTGDEVAKQAEVDSPAKALVVPADAAVNARATMSGTAARRPCRVRARRRGLFLPAHPCADMISAMVFSPTRHPAARRSSVTRGEP